MKKRLLTVLLAVCLILALGTVSALAVDTLPAPVGDVITLEDNVTMQASAIQSALETLYTETDAIVIDLAQHTLTITQPDDTDGTGIRITQGKSLTIRNGSIVANEQANGSHSVLIPLADTSLIMENVNMTTNGTALYPAGDASNIEVRDCNITAGVYVVGTNASVADGELIYSCNVNISLVDSILSAVGYENNDGQTCTVMINVPGTLNIDNCKITGGTQAVLIRGGDATITDSNISIDNTYTGSDYDQYKEQNWGSGNSVPIGAIIVGNRGNTGSAYHYPASCDISGTTVSASDGETSLYVYQMDNTDDNREVTLKIDSGDFGKVEITDANDEKVASIGITGGTYDSNVSAYIQDGAALTQDEATGEIVPNPTVISVASVNGIGYNSLTNAIAAADDGDTVTLLEDEEIDTSLELKDGITLDLGGNTLTSTDDYTVVCATGASAEVKNGNLTGGTNSTVYNNGTALTLNGVNITYSGSRCAIQNNTGSLTLVDCTVNGGSGGGIWDFGTKSSVTLTSSTVTGGYFAVYHNGSTAGFTLTAENSTIIGDSDVACAIYVSGSTTSTDRDGMNSINLTGCTVTGPTGIEGKYTNMVLTDCDITATAEPDFEQNNNGTTALGFAVVSTDNSMDPNSPAPESDITINGGAYDGIVGLGQYENIDEYEGFQESDYTVTGGSFANPLPSEYLDDGLNAELYSRSNSDTPYSYYSTVDEAMDAAQPGDIVTDLSNVTSSDTRYNVTFNYGNNDSETVSVSEGATITFTAPTRSGYEFRGWRDNSGKLHKAGETVTVNSDMTFTAVWSAINIPDTYDIEIADAANGSVDTSLSNASAGSTITITATPDSGYSVASVTVTGPDGRVDVVRVNATTYTFKMPAGDVTVRVTFTDSDALPFTDVSAGQWFYDAVAYVYTNGMMEGDSATTFNPDGTMTRAMFWAVLGRIDGATITGTNWADQARDWAMAEGVSDGTDPNSLVTREQMVTMLWRYAGEPESSASLSAYTDADSVSDWAETAMRWAIDEGIITGMTDTTLVPQGTATRAQCAAIFMRFDQM